MGTGPCDYRIDWHVIISIGRFLAADTIVPEPGNPQALNRYSYVLNNPLRYTDPSGHAPQHPGDSDDTPGDCATQWCWENRWYRAHGATWNGSGWSQTGADAHFYDEGILNDTMGEAGISFVAGDWNWNSHQAQMSAIGQGIVRFGRALSNGLAQLKHLLSGGAIIKHGSLLGHPNALPPGTHTVHMPYTADVTYNQQTIVHELAHIIDWNGSIGGTVWAYGSSYATTQRFSDAWHGAPLTDYAACTFLGNGCVNRWERWAEAVTVFVYGSDYARALGMKNDEFLVTGQPFSDQIKRIEQLLNGWW